MAKNQVRRIDRDRLDHILPQGYLEGFSDPNVKGQLSVFDLKREKWFESGTARIGAQRAYYDYSPGANPDILLACVIGAAPAQAQLFTQHIKGITGLKAGSEPPPYVYVLIDVSFPKSVDSVERAAGFFLDQ